MNELIAPRSSPAKSSITGQHLYRVQQAIAAGEWREHYQAEQWAGHAVGRVLDIPTGEDDVAGRAKVKNLIKTWTREGALKVEVRNDAKREPRKWIVVDRWQTDSAPLESSTAKLVRQVGQSGRPTTTPAIMRGGGARCSEDHAAVGHGNFPPDTRTWDEILEDGE